MRERGQVFTLDNSRIIFFNMVFLCVLCVSAVKSLLTLFVFYISVYLCKSASNFFSSASSALRFVFFVSISVFPYLLFHIKRVEFTPWDYISAIKTM
jgi:hypothetical protein